MRGKAIIAMAVVLFFACRVPAVAAPGKELWFGMSAAFSGAVGEFGKEFRRGVMAYLDHVNEQGGVNGRELRVVQLDDGYDPDVCFDNTLSFLRDKRTFALFSYTGTVTSSSILPLLHRFKQDDVYLLFPLTGAQPLREEPYGRYVFNLRASYFEETRGLVDHLVAVGRKRIAVFYQADAYGRSGWDGVQRALRRHGLELASQAAYPRSARNTADFSEEIDILQCKDTDAVICVGSTEPCSAFIAQARQEGVSAPIAVLSVVSTNELVDYLTREGHRVGFSLTRNIIQSQVVPSYEDTSLEGVRLYRRVMDHHAAASGAGPGYSFQSLEGFLNSRLLCEVIRRMGDDVRPARIPEVMNTITSLDLGIGRPVVFGPDRRQGLDTVYYTSLVDDGHAPVRDWERWRK